jgi:S-adenosylmethionine synthetase
MSRRLFPSESVTEWHPDKIADQISDTIDSKIQVALEYDGATASPLDTVVVSAQHAPAVSITGRLVPDSTGPAVELVPQSPQREGIEFDPEGYRVLDLDLLRPINAGSAAYGSFGRELSRLAWRGTGRVAELRTAASA